MNQQAKEPRLSRRGFNRIAALAGAAAFLPGGVADAQKRARSKPESASKSTAGEGGLTAADRAEVAAKYQAVIRKWGQRLSPAQRERVRRVLVSHQRMLQPVRAFELANPDPPAPVLRFLTEEAKAAYLRNSNQAGR